MSSLNIQEIKMPPKQRTARIYIIRNNIPERIHMVYIGSTTQSMSARFSNHRCSSRKPELSDNLLYADMRKYGTDRFQIYLLEEFPITNMKQLLVREYEVISGYDKDCLYNQQFTTAIEEAFKAKQAVSIRKTIQHKQEIQAQREKLSNQLKK